MLTVMAGVDPADAATKLGEGKNADYTQALKADALKAARLGVARDFLGQDEDVDWAMEASLDLMRKQGATIVEVRLPKWLLDSKGEFYSTVRYPEFIVQIAEYLKATPAKYPKNINELIDRARQMNAPRPDGASPNPGRWALMLREAKSGTLSDYQYTSVRDHGLPTAASVSGRLRR